MKNKGIFFCLLFAIILGCLFQYMRVDGFLTFGSFHNEAQQRLAAEPWQGADSLQRDSYVIYYDPSSVTSMYARHNVEMMLERQKKTYESRRVDALAVPIPQSVRGVLIAAENPDLIRAMTEILSYGKEGGTVLFLQRLVPGTPDGVAPAVREAMGISSLGTLGWAHGMEFRTSFLLGGQGISVAADYTTQANGVSLTEDTTVEIASSDGTIPLLWTHPYGKGQVIAYNGNEREDKTLRGLLAAMLFHAGNEAIYPVVGVKLFYLDDFPAPIPKGREAKIYEDTGLATRDFYRNEWWPFIRKLAETYDLRLTGGIIATYDNQVQGPFPADVKDGRNSLIRYGREILNKKGELALHGYNHQPLTMNPKGLEPLRYKPWPDEKTMAASLEALHQYSRSVYPEYTFQVYIAPSNILDENGVRAVRQAVPSVRVICASYDESNSNPQDVQEFRRRKDGLYDLPRISSGHRPSGSLSWRVISAINDLGVFSHFIHPDEILFEEDRNTSWSELKVGLDTFLNKLTMKFPWLTPVTASGSLPYFDTYFDLDYRVLRTPAYLEIHAWGHQQEACFLLRSKHVPDHTEGCTAHRVDQGVYLIRMKGETARLYWKDDVS